MIDGDDRGAVPGMNDSQGNPMYSRKTCVIAALSTTLSSHVTSLGHEPRTLLVYDKLKTEY
jgi:hypothetical protein